MCGSCDKHEWAVGDCALLPNGTINNIYSVEHEDGIANFYVGNGKPFEKVWLDDLRECK